MQTVQTHTRSAIPERGLWASVLTQALKDAIHGRNQDAEPALNFLLGSSKWFYQVCDMANVDAAWVKRKTMECLKDPKRQATVRNLGARFQNRNSKRRYGYGK